MSDKSTPHINATMNEVVSNPQSIPAKTDAERMMGVNSSMTYIQADAFIGNPYAILGNVIEVRKSNGECPANLNDDSTRLEFSVNKIIGVMVDEASKLKEPIKKESLTVDQKLTSQIGFLHYLNGQFEANTSFSLMVFDQNTGVLNRDDDKWKSAVDKWKAENQDIMNDDEVCYLFAIIGFVQKYIIRKKYKKFNVGAKGGAFGINLNGELFTSTEDYSLDIIFGLQTVTLKRPEPKVTRMGMLPTDDLALNKDEKELLQSLTTGKSIEMKA